MDQGIQPRRKPAAGFLLGFSYKARPAPPASCPAERSFGVPAFLNPAGSPQRGTGGLPQGAMIYPPSAVFMQGAAAGALYPKQELPSPFPRQTSSWPSSNGRPQSAFERPRRKACLPFSAGKHRPFSSRMAGSELSHEFTVIPPTKETAKDQFSAAVSRAAVRRYEPAALRAAALPCGRARGSVHTSTPYRQNHHRTLRLAARAQSPDTAGRYIKAPKDAPSKKRAAAAPARTGIPLLSKCGRIHPRIHADSAI